MTHPNQPPFTEHERVVQALRECSEEHHQNKAESWAFEDLADYITPEGARKLVALLRL